MDWNGNRKQDSFDSFMNYKLSKSGKGNKTPNGGCLTLLIIMVVPFATLIGFISWVVIV